jgi:hypothetical protein
LIYINGTTLFPLPPFFLSLSFSLSLSSQMCSNASSGKYHPYLFILAACFLALALAADATDSLLASLSLLLLPFPPMATNPVPTHNPTTGVERYALETTATSKHLPIVSSMPSSQPTA